MKKKKELKYFDGEWAGMKRHLKAFLATADQEDLHSFRVQVKKIRALLILVAKTSGQPKLTRLFKPVRGIFAEAGLIREAHINLGLAKKYEMMDSAFEALQQGAIEEGTARFRENGKTALKILRDVKKKIHRKLKRIRDKQIAEFYNTQLHDIAVNLVVSGFTEDMHTNRKLIKILVYNHKIANQALNGLLNFNVGYLDKLQGAIGKWHDNVLAAELIAAHKAANKQVVKNINRKNAGVKRNISTMAEDFLEKATAQPDPKLN